MLKYISIILIFLCYFEPWWWSIFVHSIESQKLKDIIVVYCFEYCSWSLYYSIKLFKAQEKPIYKIFINMPLSLTILEKTWLSFSNFCIFRLEEGDKLQGHLMTEINPNIFFCLNLHLLSLKSAKIQKPQLLVFDLKQTHFRFL